MREAIRQGIQSVGYVAIFIDEVEHNDLIKPQLLKYIRDSKFVVVDLTHKNNGAYFEEGYAIGLGKSIIQLCKKRQDSILTLHRRTLSCGRQKQVFRSAWKIKSERL